MSKREDECFRGRKREERDWFGLVEFGFFLILIGTILLATPNAFDRIGKFFNDFDPKAMQIYEDIYLPAPKHEHPGVYTTVMYFCLVYGLFQIVILILRFAQKSPIDKKAGTLGGIVFWLGAAIFANALVTGGRANWYLFIGGVIVSIGLAIMVRAFVTLLFRREKE